MNVVAVSNIQTRVMDTATPLSRGSHTISFQDLLASISETASEVGPALPPIASQSASLPQPDNTVVRQGDCLSRICADQLKEREGVVSQRELHAAVKEVAKANHIVDPNKIHAGQKLDLSVLNAFALGGEQSKALAVQEPAKPWKSLVEGAVALSSKFGLRKDPFTGQVKQHDGIDVAAPAGASISAFAAGSVIYSGWKYGYGNTVIIRHEDGLESVYGHVSKSLVHVGEQVESHAPIASVGSTGRSTGAHLHFEIRKNGKAMDPISLLNGDALQVT